MCLRIQIFGKKIEWLSIRHCVKFQVIECGKNSKSHYQVKIKVDDGFRYLILASLPLPVQPLSTLFLRPNFAKKPDKGILEICCLRIQNYLVKRLNGYQLDIASNFKEFNAKKIQNHIIR